LIVALYKIMKDQKGGCTMRTSDTNKTPFLFVLLSLSAIFAFGLICIIGSGGGGGGGGDDGGTETTGAGSEIVGLAQKGPFILGSDITVQELDDSLNSIGTQFTTEIINDLGEFTISPNLTSQFVEVIGDGYYYDEIAGDLSSGTLNLWAIADLDSGTEANINVLTYLEKTRLKTLILEGKSFDEARAQAKSEVIAAFTISESNISDFDKMDISETGTSNAILLSVSSILLQMAHESAIDESNIPAELSEILSTVATDIGTDGTLDSQQTKDDICAASMNLDLETVRYNLENRYLSLGQTITVPPFEDYVDSDCDGFLNKYDTDIEGYTPENVTAKPGKEQVSISWDSVDEALKYNIYWSTTSGVSIANYEEKIENIDSNSYSHENLTNDTTYYYIVTAENTNYESRASSEVFASPYAPASNVIGTIPVGSFPNGIEITNDGNYLYVTNANDNTISVIQTSDNTVFATIALTDANFSGGITVTPDDSYVYVAYENVNTGYFVSVIRTSDNTVIDNISVGSLPNQVTVNPNGSFVYVTHDVDNESITVIDTSSNSVVQTISGVDPYLGDIAITPDGSYAYVANYLFPSEKIYVIRTSDNTVEDIISSVISNSYDTISITTDGSLVYVGGENVISVIQTSDNSVIETVSTDIVNCSGITVTPDGSFIYLVDSRNNSVSIIQTSNYAISDNISVGSDPQDIAGSPSGDIFYVPNSSDGTVSVIGY
jgi:YVTN family beta-propeller protein